MKIYEDVLKSQLISKFRREHVIDTSSIVASEFVLGNTGCRADLAIWTGDRLIGIEVKSACDTLARLPKQLDAYHRIFDEVILLCDVAHLPKALEICREGTGVCVWTGSLIQLQSDPKTQVQDRMSLVRALTLKQLQSCLGVRSTERLSRREAERRVFDDVSIDVRAAFIAGFVATYQSSTDLFWQAVSGRRISHSHLGLLSRFALARAEAKVVKRSRQDFWAAWSQQAQAAFG